MYLDYYRLKLAPFDNSPNPHFFYASEGHREALASVEYTIRMRKGIVLITGDIGSGKTTISTTMQHRLREVACTYVVRHGLASSRELLAQLCRTMQLNVPPKADRGLMLDAIESQLMVHHRAGRPVVLIVDEAQSLSLQVLDEIRMLSNLETPSQKLLQIILIGQPELRNIIQSPPMAALRQRIVLSHHLNPLSLEDVALYINHRLAIAAAGSEPEAAFDDRAILAIHQATGGVPRLINTVCDNSLLVGFVRSRKLIDAEIVAAVTEHMMPLIDTQAMNINGPLEIPRAA